jgi:transposase-like protein
VDSNKNIRELKGQEMAKQVDCLKRIDDYTYQIKSQSSNNIYEVNATELGFVCSCPDHKFRGVKCKHIYCVEFSQQIRQTVKEQVVIKPVDVQACPVCLVSDNVVRHGIRNNQSGKIQKFFCKCCNKWFSINFAFEKMHATPNIITSAMQLYFSNESYRNIKKFLELQGLKISHVAVYKWITKYVKLMDKYLEQIKPNVSGAWRTDELYFKVKGNTKYLYALMDDETRFWIAQQVGDSKYTEDIKPLLQKGKEITGKRPLALISDGAPNFSDAVKKEFFTLQSPRTKHIRHIRLQGDHNNNKMERLNGEVRDREKVTRGLKKVDSPLLKGYQIYHNYIREHEGLKGKTPAEKCGIKIEGNDKWMTIIQNAQKELKVE